MEHIKRSEIMTLLNANNFNSLSHIVVGKNYKEKVKRGAVLAQNIKHKIAP
jgi:hypothetical protein